MFATLAARLVSRPALRLVSRPTLLNTPNFYTPISSRTFLTTARVQLPAAATNAKKSTSAKAAKPAAKKKAAPKKKVVPKKKAAPKKVVKAKKPVKKVAKKVVKKKEEPKFSKAELKPPKPASTSGFSYFVKERLSNKKVAFGEMASHMKEASVAWNELPEAAKMVYSERSKGAQEQYKKDYAAWYNGLSPEALKAASQLAKKKKKIIKHPADYPKRAILPFTRVLLELREQNPSLTFFEGSKQASAQWKAMTDAQKEPYVKAYEADRSKWIDTVKAYKARHASA